jgi:hypothetical protein
MTKWIASAALVPGLLLGLTGCGGSTSSTDPTHAAAAATGAPAAPTGATPSRGGAVATTAANTSLDPKATKAGDAAGSIPDQLCVFLDREHQMASDAGTPAKARARVSTDFKAWQEHDKNLAFGQAAELDAITKSQCPKVRARILDLMKSTDLASALG